MPERHEHEHVGILYFVVLQSATLDGAIIFPRTDSRQETLYFPSDKLYTIGGEIQKRVHEHARKLSDDSHGERVWFPISVSIVKL